MSNDSIKSSGNWHTDGGIVVPGATQQEYVPRGMEQTHTPTAPRRQTHMVLAADSAAQARQDSIARAKADSVRREVNHYGLVLTDPYGETAATSGADLRLGRESWIFAALAMLFCLICFKFRNSPRYLGSLMSELMSTRVRNNMFDNTVRETSFLIILNIGWSLCAGILLWNGVASGPVFNTAAMGFSIPDAPLAGIGLCSAVAAVYVGAMLLAYWGVGNVFSDKRTTAVWVSGAAASYALQTFFLLPLALLSLCYPGWQTGIMIAAAIVFIIFKILFIYKGIRIFLRQNISWLIFLYYLCSLEIVPLILTCITVFVVCSSWL